MNKEDLNGKTAEELRQMLQDYYLNKTDDEFDPDMVMSIYKLLEVLDPIPEDEAYTPEASWERFKEKYPDALKKVKKKRRRHGIIITILSTAAALVLTLFIFVGGTTAYRRFHFIDEVTFSSDGVEFIVTGEEDYLELENIEELKNIYCNILFPTVLPDGMEFVKSNISHDDATRDTITIRYLRPGQNKDVYILYTVSAFEKNDGKISLGHTPMEYIGTETIAGKEVRFSKIEKYGDVDIMAEFIYGRGYYKILSNITKEEIVEFIENFEYEGKSNE